MIDITTASDLALDIVFAAEMNDLSDVSFDCSELSAADLQVVLPALRKNGFEAEAAWIKEGWIELNPTAAVGAALYGSAPCAEIAILARQGA